MNIAYTVCRTGAREPTLEMKSQGGIIFYIPKHLWEHETYEIKPLARMTIPLGVKMNIPPSVGLMITNIASSPVIYGLVIDTLLIHADSVDEIIISVRSTNNDHSIFLNVGDGIAVGVIIKTETYKLINGEPNG